MKKIMALVLAVLLLSVPALAEETGYEWTEMEYTPAFEGAEVYLEDLGVNITLPVEWLILEVTEEQAATGVLYTFATEARDFIMTINYSSSEDVALSYELLYDSAIEAGYDAALISINEIPFVFANLNENTIMGMLLFDEFTCVNFGFNYTGEDSELANDYALGVLGSMYSVEAE